MNPPDPKEVFQMMLASAMKSDQPDSGSHVADDDDLLYKWSLGELSVNKLQDIRSHLARCGYCRAEVAEMIRAEALILPPVEEDTTAQETVQPARDEHRTKWNWWGVSVLVTAAAAVLVGILLLQQPTELSMLQLAQQKLEQGDAETAMTMATEYLQGREMISPEQRALGEQLLNHAAYELAAGALEASDFGRVVELEQRVAQLTEPTADLQNLKLQAEYGLPGELSLAMNDSLTQYGYKLDGFAGNKSFPTFDEKTERLKGEFQELISEHPESAALRLNYGYLLLRESDYENARTEFDAVRGSDPDNELALTGMGLIAFETENYPEARRFFQAALVEAPQSADCHINLAMALEQLKEDEEAEFHWQEASKLTQDRELRQRIEMHLRGRKRKE